jgi:DNA-binding SARP family transcriptional activator
VPLPELTALGLGVLVAAALARRARKARHLASLARREGQPPAVVSELAADTDTLVSPFEGAPVLEWLETANRHLTSALGQMGRAADAPMVQLVRVGPDGVEMRLTEPVSWAPEHWVLQGGQVWHLSSSLRLEMVATEARGHQPWLPSLAPIGENDEGTWLVPVEPGCCLPVIGAGADALVSAMRVAAESWTWSEQVVVTDDVVVAEHASALADRSADSLDRPRVLFVGDPEVLSAGARARCGVITTLPLPATDITVAVDAKAASLHPLGVTLRPHLLDHARSVSVAELVRIPGPQPIADPDDLGDLGGPDDFDSPDHGPAFDEIGAPTARIAAVPHVAVNQRGPHEPGRVEVRLLTAVPRIDGLADELPPKRARRATELVAYLALHHPDPVTSDRLRTRVLGSADADAAAKTLFNTVGAGRRAMGRDPSGELYLPPATKSGQYRVSPLVTVDVTRATALVAAADAAADVDMSIALLREALDLVEGEPLAGTLTGYAWWGAEGHERRISTELVDGACRLARLAAGSGYFDLARWAVEQARLVEPYSEALSRVAMEVAAKTGDAGRLRREWVECQRRVDELDPGSLPSESTERLYAELRRQVPA